MSLAFKSAKYTRGGYCSAGYEGIVEDLENYIDFIWWDVKDCFGEKIILAIDDRLNIQFSGRKLTVSCDDWIPETGQSAKLELYDTDDDTIQWVIMKIETCFDR